MARKSLATSTAQEILARVNGQMKADVLTMGSDPQYVISRVPTGILTVDRLLNGGFARGRHSEVFGDWLVGKSLLCYTTLALAQSRGEVCALVDAERVFDQEWFKQLGGNPRELIMATGKNANTLGNTLRAMIQGGDFAHVDFILIDSIASMLPREEEEYDLESDKNARTASLARLMSLLLRQLTMQNEDTTFLWTNQWRDKISHIPGQQSTPGGRAMGFYASTRLEMAKGEKEMEEYVTVYKGANVTRKRALGTWVRCTVRKEKTGARPESSKAFLLDYTTKSPDVARELIDLGMEDEIIKRTGDNYEVIGYDHPVKCHGIKRMVTKIREDDELQAWLLACVEEATWGVTDG